VTEEQAESLNISSYSEYPYIAVYENGKPLKCKIFYEIEDGKNR